MLTHSVTWRWDELRLGPQAWRDPRSEWGIDEVLDVLASLTGGIADPGSETALVERIVPRRSLLEIDQLHLDPSGALRPRDATRVDGDLLAWILESLWGRPDTLDGLIGGWTLARVREDGVIAQVCVPLNPTASGLTLIGCSLAAEDRQQVVALASRLTWLSSLKPDTIKRSVDVTRGPLTERQRTILAAMARGLTNRQIASRINFSESTVRMESMAIYRIYGVHSRMEAVAAARASGHLPLEELPRRAYV